KILWEATMSDFVTSGDQEQRPQSVQANSLIEWDQTGAVGAGVQFSDASYTGDSAGGPVVERVTPRKHGVSNRADKNKGARPQSRPEDRDALRRYWERASKAAAEMIDVVEADDPASLFSAGDDLEYYLNLMWEIRHTRGVNWQSILNLVQGVVKEKRRAC